MTQQASRHLRTSISVTVSFLLAACNGGDSTPPDAPAAVTPAPDAPAAPAIHGLGQHCGPNLPACPATMFCALEAGPAHAYCTSTCYSGSFTTDADGSPITFPDPEPGDQACAGTYSAGAPGTPSCSGLYHLQPPAPLAADTDYTVDFVCTIACGANKACPQGLQCNADDDCTP